MTSGSLNIREEMINKDTEYQLVLKKKDYNFMLKLYCVNVHLNPLMYVYLSTVISPLQKIIHFS